MSDLEIVGIFLLGLAVGVVVMLLDWPNNKLARHRFHKSMRAADRLMKELRRDTSK